MLFRSSRSFEGGSPHKGARWGRAAQRSFSSSMRRREKPWLPPGVDSMTTVENTFSTTRSTWQGSALGPEPSTGLM